MVLVLLPDPIMFLLQDPICSVSSLCHPHHSLCFTLDCMARKSHYACCVFAGGCWFLNQFVLTVGSHIIWDEKDHTKLFFAIWFPAPYTGSLNSACVKCVFDSVFIRPLLLLFGLLVYPFGQIMWLD
jgi:hypothetical protein